MHIIYRLKLIPKTFAKLAEAYMDIVMKLFEDPNVKRVDMVLDMYCDDISIKTFEQSDRQKGGIGCEVKILSPKTLVSQG